MLGWVCGAGVTWLVSQSDEYFFRYGWLFAGLIGGLLYGGLQTLGFNPWVTASPISWMTQTAIAWISAYALGAVLLGRETSFHISEFIFISWAVLEPFLFIIYLILFPTSHGYRPYERGP